MKKQKMILVVLLTVALVGIVFLVGRSTGEAIDFKPGIEEMVIEKKTSDGSKPGYEAIDYIKNIFANDREEEALTNPVPEDGCFCLINRQYFQLEGINIQNYPYASMEDPITRFYSDIRLPWNLACGSTLRYTLPGNPPYCRNELRYTVDLYDITCQSHQLTSYKFSPDACRY